MYQPCWFEYYFQEDNLDLLLKYELRSLIGEVEKSKETSHFLYRFLDGKKLPAPNLASQAFGRFIET